MSKNVIKRPEVYWGLRVATEQKKKLKRKNQKNIIARVHARTRACLGVAHETKSSFYLFICFVLNSTSLGESLSKIAGRPH